MNGSPIPVFKRPVSALNFIEFVRKLINSTCLVFTYNDENGKQQISKFRLVIAIFLPLLLMYQTITTLIYALTAASGHQETAIMFLCWTMQAFFSTCFLVYWQFRGQLNKLFNEINWNQFQIYDCKASFNLKLLYVGYFVSVIIDLGVNLIILYSYYWGDLSLVDLKSSYFKYYGGHRFAFITSIIITYALYVWLAVIMLYCIFSWIVYKEIDALNLSVKQIGASNADELDKAVISDKLLKLYDRQIMLSLIVEEVNSMFEVYSFTMLAINIPTTIFSLVTFIRRLQYSAYYSAIFMLPGITFCIIEIIALTHAPSKVHTSIHSIEKSIFINRVFWFPYDQKLYDISRMFVSHVNQSSLGISLWGFTPINKSLILTTASLTITYLVLLLQIDKS